MRRQNKGTEDRTLDKQTNEGFSLAELILAISIVGILSTVALPKYYGQVNRSRQNEVVSTVARIQTAIATYADEFGVLPTSWAELNESSAIMTDEGPATQDNFQPITLAGGFYNVKIDYTDNLFTVTATRNDEPNLNIIACINLTNGASGINQGTNDKAATSPNCV